MNNLPCECKLLGQQIYDCIHHITIMNSDELAEYGGIVF